MYDEIILQADHYFQLRKYDQALDYANKALAERPHDGHALYLRALCLSNVNQYNEALGSCKEALEIGYRPDSVHDVFAHIYMNMKDYPKAEEHILESLRINPNNAATLASYSLVMYETGFFDKSKALMDEATRIDPQNPTVLENKMEMSGEKDEVQNYTENASGELDRLLNMGNHYIDQKQYQKARDCFRQAYLMVPENKEILNALNQLDMVLSPIMFPNRIFWHVNTFVLWGVCIAVAYGLRHFGFTTLSTVFIIIYLIFAVYTWVSKPLYKLIHRKD